MTTEVAQDDVRINVGALMSAIWRRRLRIILVTLGMLAATFVVLMFMPRMYESSASLLIAPRDSAFLRATNDSSVSGEGSADDAAIESQIQLIQSRDSLRNAIENADLMSEPELNGISRSPIGTVLQLFGGKPSTRSVEEIVLANISENLTVVRERDSRIVTIIYRSQDPELAARVANAIAETHVQRAAGLVISDTADASRWLEPEIEKLRQRVAEAEEAVANYRVENDLLTGADATSLLDQQLSDIATQITAAQERKSTAQSRATVLRGLIEAGQPIEGVAAVRDSQTIQQLIEEKGRLASERAQRLATLLPNHPDVRALSEQVEELDRQIVAEGRKVADALEAEAQVEAEVEQALRNELARLKVDASGATRNTVALNELEREATAQRELLETYLLRYRDASARTEANSALPDVRIVSAAAPALSPASPKVPLIMAAVLIVALIGQVGYILLAELVSGRALDAYEPYRPVSRQREVQPEYEATHASPPAPVAPQQPERQEPPEPAPAQRQVQNPADWRTLQQPPVSETVAAEAPLASEHEEPGLPYDIVALAGSVVRGRDRIIFVATLGAEEESDAVVDMLTGELLEHDLSVVLVDGSSCQPSSELGLSDLCAYQAGFGDVVHRSNHANVARVPWGQQQRLDHRSPQAVTLAEALTDVYDAVIVTTGRPGIASSLPLFSDVEGPVLVASIYPVDEGTQAGIQADASALGFDRVKLIQIPGLEAEVA